MCMVSAVGNNFQNFHLPQTEYWPHVIEKPSITRAEFEAIRRDIEELKKVLTAAKKFDEATGQKDCEMDDKVALIKSLAKLVGVEMSDIFPE